MTMEEMEHSLSLSYEARRRKGNTIFMRQKKHLVTQTNEAQNCVKCVRTACSEEHADNSRHMLVKEDQASIVIFVRVRLASFKQGQINKNEIFQKNK